MSSSRQQAGKAPTCVTAVRDLRRGRQRWRTRRAAAQVQFPSKSSRTSLTVAGNLVYTLDTHLSALAASSGRIRWQRLAPPASRPGVLGADAAVVCAACDSLFAVYRARDGAALWQLDRRDGNGPFLGMALMGETIYVSSGVGARRDGFALEARDAVTGTLRSTWPTAPGQEHGDQEYDQEHDQGQKEFPARRTWAAFRRWQRHALCARSGRPSVRCGRATAHSCGNYTSGPLSLPSSPCSPHWLTCSCATSGAGRKPRSPLQMGKPVCTMVARADRHTTTVWRNLVSEACHPARSKQRLRQAGYVRSRSLRTCVCEPTS